jgi:hypothetical protein
MDVSDRFLRFAAECVVMAKFTPSPENETVWHQMAERWLRIAELHDHQNSLAKSVGSIKRHRKPERSGVRGRETVATSPPH